VLLVQSVFQDGFNTFVEVAVDGQGIGAGGFETFFRVLFPQAQNA
jgi:ABC-type spermidine/putrescine transport system permease subunit I